MRGLVAILILPLVLAATGAAGAQGAANADRALRFERLSHDFGTVSDEKPLSTSIAFTNAHPSRTITVGDVKTSCGCLTANVPTRTLAPGASGTVELVYNPAGRQGKDRKGITLVTDDPKGMRIDLTVDIHVVARLWFEPMSIHLGEVRHDEIAKRRIAKTIVVTARNPEFAVKSARVLDPALTLREAGVETRGEGAETVRLIRYEVAAERDLPIGRIDTRVVIETNDPKKPELVVAVAMLMVGELKLSQEPIHLRMTKAGAPLVREYNLSARSGRSFEVKKAYISGCAPMTLELRCLPISQGGKTLSYLVRLSGVTPPPATFVTGTLVFETDVPGQPRFEVEVTGGVPMPATHAAPTSQPASRPASPLR